MLSSQVLFTHLNLGHAAQLTDAARELPFTGNTVKSGMILTKALHVAVPASCQRLTTFGRSAKFLVYLNYRSLSKTLLEM